MTFDTSIHNQLRNDFRSMEGDLHDMVENIHNYEDNLSEELQEAEEMEHLLSHCLKEIENLEERNLALERLEESAEEGLKQGEEDIARDMFSDLHQLAKDIDNARAVIGDLQDKNESDRKNITKLGEVEEKLINGQEKLTDDEDGMLHRLEDIHPDYDAEVDMDWLKELEYKYEDSDPLS